MAGTQSVDVVVVGGGLAGVTAARALEDAGRSVALLEATEEVGGHLHSRVIDGQVIDFGGEAISEHHQRVFRLASELGLTVDKSAFTGVPSFLWRLTDEPREGYAPPLSPTGVPRDLRVLLRMRQLAREVPPDACWEAPRADYLDGITFGEWLQEQGMQGPSYELAVAVIGGYATFELERVSLLYVLRWISRVGGVWQAYRHVIAQNIREGVQQLVVRSAQRIRGEVVRQAPVHSVVQDGSGVSIDAGDHGSWRAKRAVIAVPISLMNEISFDPPLDPELQAFYSEMRYGRAVKAAVVAAEKPWVKHRVSVGGTPIQASWLRGGRGATGLVTGDATLVSSEEITADLAGIYGLDAARSQTDLVKWSEQPFRGGTYLVWEPGQLTKHGPNLKRSHKLVHFAGADRSSWTGMEGAIENGEEVAAAIDAELSRA
jgi:monoamine oxidase